MLVELGENPLLWCLGVGGKPFSCCLLVGVRPFQCVRIVFSLQCRTCYGCLGEKPLLWRRSADSFLFVLGSLRTGVAFVTVSLWVALG